MTPTPDPSDISLDAPNYEAFRANLPFAVELNGALGIFSIPKPPPSFNPRTASRHDLLRHGILLRKPGETGPQLCALWDKFITGRLRLVQDAGNPTLRLIEDPLRAP